MMLDIIAFCAIAGMLSVYTLLDGYDLGAGAISLVLAKTRPERRAILKSIGPFWSGNEVWLIAAGGALFAFFPKAYAVSFSGFYLPFIIVLWLLMFRGVAIEVRDHLRGDVWTDFWDAAFSISSLLLIVLFGVALGNLVRGLPLNPDGYFLGTFSSLLNPYAVSVGVLALLALVQHGLAYVAANVEGQLGERALQFIGRLWWFALVAYIVVSVATITRYGSGGHASTGLAVAASAIAVIALVALSYTAARRRAVATFRASLAFVAGLLVAASATMYPFLIRPLPGAKGGLTIFEGSVPPATLAVSLTVALAGLVLVAAYSIFIRRRWL